MRKLIAVIFLFLITSTTEAGEVFKLPFIVSHWRLHHQEDRTVSFYNFLKEHYATEHNDSDKQQDEHLPFKTMHIDHFMFVYTSHALAPLKSPLKHSPAPFNTFYSRFIPANTLLAVFHPPRIYSLS